MNRGQKWCTQNHPVINNGPFENFSFPTTFFSLLYFLKNFFWKNKVKRTFNYEIMGCRSCYFVSLMLFLWLNLHWRHMNNTDVYNSHFSYACSLFHMKITASVTKKLVSRSLPVPFIYRHLFFFLYIELFFSAGK